MQFLCGFLPLRFSSVVGEVKLSLDIFLDHGIASVIDGGISAATVGPHHIGLRSSPEHCASTCRLPLSSDIQTPRHRRLILGQPPRLFDVRHFSPSNTQVGHACAFT